MVRRRGIAITLRPAADTNDTPVIPVALGWYSGGRDTSNAEVSRLELLERRSLGPPDRSAAATSSGSSRLVLEMARILMRLENGCDGARHLFVRGVDGEQVE
jgi:hypothetical protein